MPGASGRARHEERGERVPERRSIAIGLSGELDVMATDGNGNEHEHEHE
jgi:hypothetical protein